MPLANNSELPSNQKYGLREYVVYIAFRVIIAYIQILSLERCDRMAKLLAKVFSQWIPIRSELIRDNLRLVFPSWDRNRTDTVQLKMWNHLLLMGCEIAQAARKIHRENWQDHFNIPDRRQFLEVVMGTHPKLLVTGHFGNFELAGFLTGLFGFPSTTIARPLDNGFVHNYFTRFRSLGGQHFLPKEGSAPAVQSLLQSGGSLSLLADQYAGNKGCWVDFLGHPASCHKGLALFTLSHHAPMLVCSNTRRDAPLQFDLMVLGIAQPSSTEEHLSSVQSLTRWYNRCLESAIRVFPEQYWWVHRRWRGDPPKLRKNSKAAA